ncbi:MAG: hypothetical protein GY788_12090 [bacterium]|nr:hypothetical protein [bacterium]
MSWLFLAGELAPIGYTISFLQRPAADVLSVINEIRASAALEVIDVGHLPDSAGVLDPMEAPWTTELVIDCGQWTAYLNNSIGGGDITAIAPAIGRMLNTVCVGAQHTDRHGPGHAATQLWLEGPNGEPPLMYIRTLSAHCQDGRWSWHTSGIMQDFEQPERYERRRISQRLDRTTLVAYLDALGIRVDDPSFFGQGIAIRQIVDWKARSQSVDEWRAENL